MSAIFDQHVLHAVAKSAISTNEPIDGIVHQIASELSSRYPGHITIPKPDSWIFNNAGGAMGAMTILHASLTEYVIVFGTPIGTEGHSGRFWSDDYFIILEGEQWAYRAGQMTRSVYKPGDMHHMPKGVAQGYRIPEHCWALEYARGFVPQMLPFGLADSFFSTLDFKSVGQTLGVYAKHVVGQLFKGKI